MFCEICNRPAQRHHIKTRGAGGSDGSANTLWLCPEHHTEIHKTGRWTFAEKYGLTERVEAALEAGYPSNRGEYDTYEMHGAQDRRNAM